MSKKRLEKNLEILKKLETLVNEFPDQRFGQIIANYVFPDYRERDFFFDEPWETLETINYVVDSIEAKKEKDSGEGKVL